jgi:hypothetical protein
LPAPPTFDPDVARLRSALLDLSPAQQLAAEVLAAGSTHAQAAEAASVTRETVTRWSGHHPGFRAALDLYRTTLAAERAEKLRHIRDRAIDVVAEQLDTADLATALAVLKAIPDPGPPAPSSASTPTAAAILDAEQFRVRHSLPPRPPVRDASGRRDSLDALLAFDYEPTDDERAAHLVVERLAEASGMTTQEHDR